MVIFYDWGDRVQERCHSPNAIYINDLYLSKGSGMSAFNTWDVRIYKITTQCLILARSFVIWSNKIQIYEKIFPDRRPGNLYHHFQLGYVFHDIIMAGFFKAQIGPIQRETYIIP